MLRYPSACYTVSIHSTPRRGWRPSAYSNRRGIKSFQSTPPLEGGGDFPARSCRAATILFQSTPPLEGGGDIASVRPLRDLKGFNPLHPSKGVETGCSAVPIGFRFWFQSTPPLEGGGDIGHRRPVFSHIQFQSTPPLEGGGDVITAAIFRQSHGFNPLHPSKGVETSAIGDSSCIVLRFQSTPPLEGGGDASRGYNVPGTVPFQSTPPLEGGGDIIPEEQAVEFTTVSIHSTPRRGWRPQFAIPNTTPSGFNPLHPSKGVETRSAVAPGTVPEVSIHSTPRRGWRPSGRRRNNSGRCGFNPLHPSKGVETQGWFDMTGSSVNVSIHSTPRRGWRPFQWLAMGTGELVSIHSTPRRGWRRRRGGKNLYGVYVSIHSTPRRGWRRQERIQQKEL